MAAVGFLFPGQSSWRSGMLRRSALLGAPSREVLEEACDVLGRDLRAADRDTEPACNRDVQVGVFVATQMHLAALEAAGVAAVVSAGLSLGEYSHLTHIGALARPDALRLVDVRGALYDQGPGGKMAAVFPMPISDLAQILAAIDGVVEIANLNSPTQNVIAGESAAVDAALRILERDHPVEAVVIDRRIPMHTSIFAPVAGRLRPHLQAAPWRAPRLPYVSNVDATPIDDPCAEDFVDRLTRHVHRPVLWRASVEACAARHAGVTFVEVGPGRVLTNLLQKRWMPARRLASDAGDPRPSLDALVMELAHA